MWNHGWKRQNNECVIEWNSDPFVKGKVENTVTMIEENIIKHTKVIRMGNTDKTEKEI